MFSYQDIVHSDGGPKGIRATSVRAADGSLLPTDRRNRAGAMQRSPEGPKRSEGVGASRLDLCVSGGYFFGSG